MESISGALPELFTLVFLLKAKDLLRGALI